MRTYREILKPGRGEGGYILGMVMIYFIVFTLIGFSLLKMGGLERLAASSSYHKTRAFYHAEGGIHRSLWLANKVSRTAASYSDSTVTVVFDSVNLEIKATGLSAQKKDLIKVTLTKSGGRYNIAAWEEL